MKNNNLDEENRKLIERYIDIFEVGDVVCNGMYLSDKNGIVTAINKSYTKITGIQPCEIIGKEMQTFLNEKYLSGEYVVLQNEELNNDCINKIKKDGETYVTEKPFSICKMALEKGKEVSLVGTIGGKESKKTVLFVGKPYFDQSVDISHVLVIMREMDDFIELKRKLQDAEKKNKRYFNELMYLRNSQIEDDIVVKDSSMEKISQLISHVAKTDATILIKGETGVGKEVVAREIYRRSNRSKQAYIKVNCAAIPESLLESEMFGYEKGAFTGADKKEKLGYFEIAQGGTLLLDEIGEMPIKLQSKLLRVLHEREITRIGGTKPIKLDVRIIAATNQKLEEQIKKGEFREDLFYRLNVIPIEVPPLRERKADIPIFAHKFIDKFTEKYNIHKMFEAAAIEVLENYDWPGNVRELENTIERLVIIGDEVSIGEKEVINVLGKEKFPYHVIENENITLKEATDILEKSIIEKALRKYKSSRKAAKALGVTQPTVLRKAKALGIKEW
jgi:Transcriptional regulator containing PAS, AAA-type ATPase, and DNA-binding domains